MGARGWLKMSNTNQVKNDKQPDWVPWSSYLMLINKWSAKSNSFWYYLWTVGDFFVFLLYLVCLFLSTWIKKKKKNLPIKCIQNPLSVVQQSREALLRILNFVFGCRKRPLLAKNIGQALNARKKKKAALKGQTTQNQNFTYFPLTPFLNLHNRSGVSGCQALGR